MAGIASPGADFVMDVEVQRGPEDVGGWNTSQMGVAVAVMYDLGRGTYHLYDHHQLADLRADILACRRVITWNGWRFDLPVIFGIDRDDWLVSPLLDAPNAAGVPLRQRSKDLLTAVYMQLQLDPYPPAGTDMRPYKGWKLGDVSKAVLNPELSKMGSGDKAVELYQLGRWGELFTYCLRDVQLNAQLWNFAVRYGYLFNAAGRFVRFPRMRDGQAVFLETTDAEAEAFLLARAHGGRPDGCSGHEDTERSDDTPAAAPPTRVDTAAFGCDAEL